MEFGDMPLPRTHLLPQFHSGKTKASACGPAEKKNQEVRNRPTPQVCNPRAGFPLGRDMSPDFLHTLAHSLEVVPIPATRALTPTTTYPYPKGPRSSTSQCFKAPILFYIGSAQEPKKQPNLSTRASVQAVRSHQFLGNTRASNPEAPSFGSRSENP